MKRKLLYVGTLRGYWVSDQYRAQGFKEHFDTVVYDYRAVGRVDPFKMGNELQKVAYDLVPDIIFINKGEIIPSIILERIKRMLPNTFMVAFNGDQRGKAQMETVLLGRVCDAILINNLHRPQWDEYLNFGIKAIYEYHTATSTDTFYPMDFKTECDVIFIGGHYGKRFPLSNFRSQCIKELSRRYKVTVAGGRQWKIYPGIRFIGNRYGIEFSRAIAKAKCILGISAYDNIYNYTSNRTWNSMACGKPYLCHKYAGIENFFTDMKNLIVFSNVDELIQKVDWIINNPESAKLIGHKGLMLMLNKHTYAHRAKQLLDIYEDWKKNR